MGTAPITRSRRPLTAPALALAAAALAAGCGDDAAGDPAADAGLTADAGAGDAGSRADAGGAPDGGGGGGDAGGPASCADLVPSEGFGLAPGAFLRGFTLPRCDADGAPYDFYGDAFCQDGPAGPEQPATVTFVGAMAGWCPRCRAETRAIRDELHADYEPRGVRFVQVLVENASFEPADLAYCRDGWLGDFGELPQVTLVDDPEVDFMERIFPGAAAFPFSAIVGPDGEVLSTDAGLDVETLRADLDAALARFE